MENTSIQQFLLVSIMPQKVKDEEIFEDLKELKELVESYGGKMVDIIIQKREVHDKGMYIGKGKVEEIAAVIKEKKIDVVVLNAMVKPGQLHDLNTLLHPANPSIQVWDRVDLIPVSYTHLTLPTT